MLLELECSNQSAQSCYLGDGDTDCQRQKWSNYWYDPEDERYAQIDINLSHPIKMTRIAMRQLASEDRKGVILPIASVGGLAGLYTCPIYIACKHGIVGFVKSMKRELSVRMACSYRNVNSV